MARSRRLCTKASELISADEFSNSVYQILAGKMSKCVKNGADIDASVIINGFSGDTESENMAAAVFFNNEEYSDSAKTLYDLIYTIKLNKLEAKIKATTDPGEIFELIKQKTALAKDKKLWSENI